MYRKFKATTIFTGEEMLTGKVLITDEDGVIVEMATAEQSGDDVEVLEGILSPGFINCHCHLELSHMKGIIPEQTGLVDFILKVVNERHLDEDTILAAIEKAEAEMWQNGIVAVGDICNNLFTLPQKRKGNLTYHNFIEASGFPQGVAETRFKRSLDIYQEYKAAFPASIVPHAAYSVSPYLFSMIVNQPGNHLLTIHNQEAIAENHFFQAREGEFIRMYDQMNIDISFFEAKEVTSLASFFHVIKPTQSIILVHNVETTGTDLELIKNDPRVWLCLCPLANLFIGNKLPEINLFMEYGCRMVIGTDSLASNYQLSILEEMKTLQDYFPEIGLPVLLKWATINGAEALGFQHNLGSFERGKQPGIILIDNVEGNKLSKGSKATRVI